MAWDGVSEILYINIHLILMIITLILNALLTPEAKKPPNGAINDANVAITKAWI